MKKTMSYAGRYDSAEDHIYVNATIANPSLVPIFAVYNDNRTQPILGRPGDYYMAVIRAEIDTGVLPMMWFRDNRLATTDPLYTSDYRVTITFGPYEAFRYVKWEAESVRDQSDLERPILSAQHFLRLVNAAFLGAFNAVVAAAAVDAVVLPSAVAPYLQLEDDRTVSFVVPKLYNNDLSGAPWDIDVHFNTALFQKFDAWLAFNNGPQTNGKDYLMRVVNLFNNSGTTAYDAPVVNEACFVMRSAYASGKLKDLDKIILTTATVPVAREFVPVLDRGTGQALGSDASSAIITDFAANEDAVAGAGRPTFVYNASVYRFIDLVGTYPMNNVTISVYTQDRYGIVRPLYVPPLACMSIKILFQKK